MKFRSIAELLMATASWGFGFLATRWALGSFGPIGMGAWRFGIASLVCTLFVWGSVKWAKFRGKSLSAGVAIRYQELTSRELWKLSLWPGVFLAGTLSLQTAGLQYTSIAHSSFLTILYVPMVPVLQWMFFKARATAIQWICVAIGMWGTVLLTGFTGFDSFNRGDALTIACAAMAAGHIFTVGKASARLKSAIAFNLGQSGVASVLSFAIMPFFGENFLPRPFESFAWNSPFGGMMFLVFVSSIVAFTLQAKAQRDLDPTTASLIFLLEGPFASALAFLILNEKMTPTQWAGAGFILLSAALATAAPKILRLIPVLGPRSIV